jgi:hypothetical protein
MWMSKQGHGANVDLPSLEARAALAGSVWACAFSTAEEFESDLIRRRRAEGRYASGAGWQSALAVGAGLMIVGAAILLF